MAKRLNDKQKKRIIADYVECQNYSEVARKYKVSRTTIKNIVAADSQSCEMLHQKKEQNMADVLSHMETKKKQVCELVDIYLEELGDREKLQKTPINQIATAMGIVIDKFTMGNTGSSTDAGENNLYEILKESAKNDIPKV